MGSMTTYERGYAAGLRAAAKECEELAAAAKEWLVFGPHDRCRLAILNLPIEGEAEGSGPCVVVPVEPPKLTVEMELAAMQFHRRWESEPLNTGYWTGVYRAMLAAAKEEHDAHL